MSVVPAREQVFTYSSDGDTNGVFYFLGTRYGSRAWANPAPTAVALTASSLHGVSQPIENLLDRASGMVHTAGGGGWFAFDLLGARLTIDYYTLRMRGDAGSSLPSSWTLAGSNDGSTYTPIQTDSFAFTTQDEYHSFAVSGSAAYRFLRLEYISDNDSSGYFVLGEVEMYGTLSF